MSIMRGWKLPPSGVYSDDFETIEYEPEKTRVWAWASVNIYDELKEYNCTVGTTIEEYTEYVKATGGVHYFHNLKFDGGYLLYYFLKNGYTHTNNRELEPYQISTLISDMGMFYSMKVRFENTEVEFRDSLKIIPLAVDDIPKTYGLNGIEKGEIDYKKIRPEGYKLDENERSYVCKDVLIVAGALLLMLENGMKKLTTGANALAYYRDITDKEEFKRSFPKAESYSGPRHTIIV